MKSRGFIKISGFLALGAIVLTSSLMADEVKHKNVLFIAIDDLNDWPASMGGYKGKIHTPNIDKIVNRGMQFRNAFSCAAECSPSRNALFWGMRQTTTGYYENGGDVDPSEAIRNNPSLTEYFMQQGYEVKGAGKLYHNAPKKRELFSDFYRPGVKQKMDRLELNGVPPAGGSDWGVIDRKKEDMFDWRNASYIVDEINKDHDKPQFLAYGIFKPHEPWYLPQEYFDRHPLDEIVLPEMNKKAYDKLSEYAKTTYAEFEKPPAGFKLILDAGKWAHGVQGYLAAVAFADDCLGRVIDALKKKGEYENTIIVLWSDHGWHLGEKHHWRKRTLWEEGIHCVLTIYALGITKKGSVCDRTVSLLDLYPTICELTGVEIPEHVEGKSLVPLLKNPETGWNHPAITMIRPGDVSVRSEKWHYIRYNGGEEELYDMDKDKMEWNDLADNPEYDSVKAELAKHIPKHTANYVGTAYNSAKAVEKRKRQAAREAAAREKEEKRKR